MYPDEPRLAISRVLDAPRGLAFQAFTDPHVELDLVSWECVADGELLEGVMHVSGRLQDGIEPFETRFRVEFHDEPDGRTRLEIRQWLPAHLAGPRNQWWLEALGKLDATLLPIQVVSADAEV